MKKGHQLSNKGANTEAGWDARDPYFQKTASGETIVYKLHLRISIAAHFERVAQQWPIYHMPGGGGNLRWFESFPGFF